jgi:glycerate dehydrogenase
MTPGAGRPLARACVVNARRLNFDNALCFDGVIDALRAGAAPVSPSSGGTHRDGQRGDDDAVLKHYDDASPSTDAIAERAKGFDVIITKEVHVDVERLPSSVKLVCEAGTGYNNIDVAKAAARGITVCNVPTYSSSAVAQLVITFVLSLSVGLVEQHRALDRGDRSHFIGFEGLAKYSMCETEQKVIGLVGGTGAIGQQVARLANALGMKVLVWSRSATTTDDWDAVSLDELLSRSDFVSIHCPLNEHTRGLIDASAMAKMKPTARIINTARGAVINESDLIHALQNNIIAGAALDVQEREPPQEDSPLYTMPQVYLTPHIGWKRLETRQRLIDSVATTIARYLAGDPINVVKPN